MHHPHVISLMDFFSLSPHEVVLCIQTCNDHVVVQFPTPCKSCGLSFKKREEKASRVVFGFFNETCKFTYAQVPNPNEHYLIIISSSSVQTIFPADEFKWKKCTRQEYIVYLGSGRPGVIWDDCFCLFADRERVYKLCSSTNSNHVVINQLRLTFGHLSISNKVYPFLWAVK